MKGKLRILIVEDHPLVRESLDLLLTAQADMAVVGKTDSGEEAVGLALDLKPDVVLMDHHLPGMSGLEATKAILRAAPESCVIGLSAGEVNTLAPRMFRAGAAASLSKFDDLDRLLETIRIAAASMEEAKGE